jgi:hypothetical protein
MKAFISDATTKPDIVPVAPFTAPDAPKREIEWEERYTIEAIPDDPRTVSVLFEWPGNKRIENAPPFAILGDASPFSVSTANTPMKISVTGYSAKSAGGTVTESATLSLTARKVRDVVQAIITPHVVAPAPTPAPAPAPVPQPVPEQLRAGDIEVFVTGGVAWFDASGLWNRLDPAHRHEHVVRWTWSDDYLAMAEGGPTRINSYCHELRGWCMNRFYDADGVYVVNFQISGPQINAGKTMSVLIQPSSPSVSVSTAEQLEAAITDNARILVTKSFDLNHTIHVKAANVRVRSSFASVVIRWTGGGSGIVPMFDVSRPGSLWLDSLVFDSSSPDLGKKGHPRVAVGDGRIAVTRCTLRRVNEVVNCERKPLSVLIAANLAQNEESLSAYLVWLAGTNIAVHGNWIPNSTREHVCRGAGWRNVAVCRNYFGNPDRTAIDPYDIAKTTINLQAGECAYVWQNKCEGVASVGPLGKANGKPAERTRGVMCDDNALHGFAQAGLEVQHGAIGVCVRQNAIRSDKYYALNIEGYTGTDTGVVYNRRVENVLVDDNRFASPKTPPVVVWPGGYHVTVMPETDAERRK